MTTGREAILGIDIGGTAVKLGLAQEDGAVVARDRFAFDRDLAFEVFADCLAQRAEALAAASGATVMAIGIAAPGYAEPVSGVLVNGTHNVPCLKGRSLTAAFAERFGRPTVTVNDGLAAANAELRFGIGRRLSRFAVVTIGTGIGGGFVLDGTLQSGRDGQPPEIGALVLDPGGERNYSGLQGTFEHLASADAFVRNDRARRTDGTGLSHSHASAEEVFASAAAGDALSQAAIDHTCRWIAQALGGMINIANLEACVIGGGVAAGGEALLDPIRRRLPDFTWPYLLARCQVTTTSHGRDGGWIGAGAWAAAPKKTSEAATRAFSERCVRER